MAIQNDYSRILTRLTLIGGYKTNWSRRPTQYISDPDCEDTVIKIGIFLNKALPGLSCSIGPSKLSPGKFRCIIEQSKFDIVHPLSKKNQFRLLSSQESKDAQEKLTTFFSPAEGYIRYRYLTCYCESEIEKSLKFNNYDDSATYTLVPDETKESYFVIQEQACSHSKNYCWISSDAVYSIIQRLKEYYIARRISDRKEELENKKPLPVLMQTKLSMQEQEPVPQIAYLSPESIKVIPDRPAIEGFYESLYRRQEVCDFALKTQDQHQIPVHTLILHHHAGGGIKKIIEARTKEITFSFSYETVKAFAEFIYFGKKSFSEELLNREGLNLFELLEFGYRYDIPALIDCCTQCIGTRVSGNNLGDIRFAAEKYHNAYLEKIVDFLCNYPLGQHIIQKKYTEIVEDSELFWSTYCQIVSLHENEEDFMALTRAIIEDLRKFFLKNRDKIHFKIIVPNDSEHFMFKEEVETFGILEKGIDDFLHYNFDDYCQYVQPYLKKLAALCGYQVNHMEEKPRQVKFSLVESVPPKAAKCEGIQLGKRNSQEVDMGSLIFHEFSPNVPSMESTLYRLYQEKMLCDFTVQPKDGDPIPVHRLVVYLYGGEVIQKMVATPMKESIDQTIVFNFSENTVKGFLDFVYLGGKAFSEQLLNGYRENLFELLDFAHTYQVNVLFDCCINAINASRKYNIDEIESAAELYSNNDLKEIARILRLD